MILNPEKRHILPLTTLWQTVFGDEPDYIALFFDGVWQRSRTFAARENGEIVSALYLLDCALCVGGERFDGYYLYAAATLPAFRGRGLMRALIREAQRFAAREDKAFIALVPANDALYDYYARFGFFPAMQRFVGKADAPLCGRLTPVLPQTYYEAAKSLLIDRFLWTPENHAYALACLAYDGVLPYAGDGGVLLTDGARVAEALAKTPRQLQSLLSGFTNITAAAPFALAGFEAQRYGMVFTPDERLRKALQTKKIYMNLALD